MSRISYRNYPILKSIKNEEIISSTCYKEDMEELLIKKDEISKLFKSNAKGFKMSTIKVSHNFMENAIICKDKLTPLIIEDSIKNKIQESGTIILSQHLYLYNIYLSKEFTHIVIFEMFSNGGIKNIIKGENIFFKSIVENKIALELNSKKGESYSFFLTSLILSILYFKKYASVEIVESKAKTKTTQLNCKYLNETDLDIEYLDSKWFTTLVNSNGFKVRGFFRLQPKKKNGEWTKELIWIDEFQKNGYTRNAKILTQTQ